MVIYSSDIEKVKKIKVQFINTLIVENISYVLCGIISAVLNNKIIELEEQNKAKNKTKDISNNICKTIKDIVEVKQ